MALPDVAESFPGVAGDGMQTTLPSTLTDGAGHLWDIQVDGTVADGTSDTFDGAVSVAVDGMVPSCSGYASLLADGREFGLLPVAATGGVFVARRVYVSPTEGYARWVEVLHNPGGSAVTASVTHYFALGSDDGTTVVTSTDGDTMISSEDLGWVTDDATDGGSDPALAVLCGDEGAQATITPMHTPGTDSPSIAYSVEVPAQEGAAKKGGRRLPMRLGGG